MDKPDRRHQARELALQALYQFDARGDEADELIEQSMADAPHKPSTKEAALKLARGAWAVRDRADALSRELAPAWPPHRQPPVDRSILRLAYYEMAGAGTPAAVAINEAVELAKAYGSERSPKFINGVLDKMAKRIAEHAASGVAKREERDDAPDTGDPFLDDALKNARPTR